MYENGCPIFIDHKCTLLFNIGSPFKVAIQEFDEEWCPHVSNNWTRKYNNGNSWISFACHVTKHNTSSTRKEGISNEK
ncbi:hypothetical protein Glove_141g19 [Diversispora epigaea]|uniref:Uncharacterized protein n=1 Tax=Diversispora epigaea TaxID=1348612 RepID=A0A397J4F4_9GLOM|nr:hypothetical protein Glove_141g19 [Diversispora epigaea]